MTRFTDPKDWHPAKKKLVNPWGYAASQKPTQQIIKTNTTLNATDQESQLSADDIAAQELTLKLRWESAVRVFESYTYEWAELAGDPLNVLEHSRLLDVSFAPTMKFIDAQANAEMRYTALRASKLTDSNVTDFERLVRTGSLLWRDAKIRAEQANYSWMPKEDSDRARKAVAALAQAKDENNPWEARVTAAEYAAKLMRAITTVVIEPKIILEIGSKTNTKALESGLLESV